ncbi:MAG: hypothetical protein Q8847_02605, partial [Sweet potato little leaf phytoplasma]|nr:hypothetical protein [Sweet potato little leaf phytoplasma]
FYNTLIAFNRIAANKGAGTPGIDNKTIDGNETPYATVPATNKETVGVKDGYKYLTKNLSHSSGKKPAGAHQSISCGGGSEMKT